MAEILSYNPYRDMHNEVQFSAIFFGKNIQNIPLFNSTQTIETKRLCYSFEYFTFTGKERDSETGFSYFGARYYDSDILTGWLSVDPMADKYPGLSPYAYCGWNPIKLVDPDGEELVFTGESEYVNSLLKIMNSCFSFSSDVFSIVDGKVQSRELNSEELNSMSEKQQAFYKTIMSAVNDDERISIGVLNNDRNVLFGSWKYNKIDVADINALGVGDGMDMYSIIAHEIAEQHYKQTSIIPVYSAGHAHGYRAEELVSGTSRLKETTIGGCIINFKNIDYNTSTFFSTIVFINKDNNVTKVIRKTINI